MPTILAADQVLITINGTLHGQRVMTTFGYVVESITGSNQDDVVFAALKTKLALANGLLDKYHACMPVEYVKGELWFQIIRPVRAVKRVLTNTAAGLSSGESAETANLAGTILRRGDLGNRRNISVVHLPSPTGANWIDNGQFTVQALTAYQELADQIILDQTTVAPAATFAPSILPSNPANLPVPISNANAQGTVRTQRRRTVGVGI